MPRRAFRLEVVCSLRGLTRHLFVPSLRAAFTDRLIKAGKGPLERLSQLLGGVNTTYLRCALYQSPLWSPRARDAT